MINLTARWLFLFKFDLLAHLCLTYRTVQRVDPSIRVLRVYHLVYNIIIMTGKVSFLFQSIHFRGSTVYGQRKWGRWGRRTPLIKKPSEWPTKIYRWRRGCKLSPEKTRRTGKKCHHFESFP